MPERIQRRRTKGWRMPENTVYVGRPSKWGNPFAPQQIPGWATASREYAIQDYTRWLTEPCEPHPRTGRLLSIGGSWPSLLGIPYDDRPTTDQIRASLAGKNLACWCPTDQPCHADVLLQLANPTEETPDA